MATLRGILIEFGQKYDYPEVDISAENLLEETEQKILDAMGLDVNGHLEAAKHTLWRRIAFVERYGTLNEVEAVREYSEPEFGDVDAINAMNNEVAKIFKPVYDREAKKSITGGARS